jgi:predicted Zn-ribbon and HTH transcriptional regulator
MTEKGIIICRPLGETTLNGLEYLLDGRNEIRHFVSVEEAGDFLRKHGINIDNEDESIILKYHAFCRQCGKEFFFDMDKLPENVEEECYFCPACKREIDEKLQGN